MTSSLSLSRFSALAAVLCFGLPATLGTAQARAEEPSSRAASSASQSDLWNLAVGSAPTGHATREDRLAEFRRAQANSSLGSGSVSASRSGRIRVSEPTLERRSPRAFVQHHGLREPVTLSSGSTSGLRGGSGSADRSRGAVTTHERRSIVVTPRNDVHLRSGFDTHSSRRVVVVPRQGFDSRRSLNSGRSGGLIIRGNTRGVTVESSPSLHLQRDLSRSHRSFGQDSSRTSFDRGSIHRSSRFDHGVRSRSFFGDRGVHSRFQSHRFHRNGASVRLQFGGH